MDVTDFKFYRLCDDSHGAFKNRSVYQCKSVSDVWIDFWFFFLSFDRLIKTDFLDIWSQKAGSFTSLFNQLSTQMEQLMLTKRKFFLFCCFWKKRDDVLERILLSTRWRSKPNKEHHSLNQKYTAPKNDSVHLENHCDQKI